MFCPNCGTKTEEGQKYCRACGLSVEKLAGLIAEQLPAGALESATPEEVAQLLRRRRKVERLLAGLGLTAGLVFALSMITMIIIKIIIGRGQYLQGGLFLAIILAAVAALALVFYRETLNESLAARGVTDETGKRLPEGPATSKLLPESRFQPVPSVTDRTTELLAAERKQTTKEVWGSGDQEAVSGEQSGRVEPSSPICSLPSQSPACSWPPTRSPVVGPSSREPSAYWRR